MYSLYTIGAFVLLFLYWRKSMNWRYKKHSHSKEFYDPDIALHSIMVTNLNRGIPLKKMNAIMKLVFEKTFPDDRVIITKAIAKLDTIYKMAVELKNFKKYYNYYRKTNAETSERKFVRKFRCCKSYLK